MHLRLSWYRRKKNLGSLTEIAITNTIREYALRAISKGDWRDNEKKAYYTFSGLYIEPLT